MNKLSLFLIFCLHPVLANDVFAKNIEPKFTPVCERTRQVVEALERETNNHCENIRPRDLRKISRLNLYSKDILAFKAGDFSGLTGLIDLDLANNPLQTLPENLFEGLKSLKTLWIPNMGLINLPQKIFYGLFMLKFLNLSNNNLSELPEGIFRDSKSLLEVSLDRNAFYELPARALGDAKNLDSLSINFNKISSLSKDQFSLIPNLRFLGMSENPIKQLDFGVMDPLSKLRTLDIGSSFLESIPDRFFINHLEIQKVFVEGAPLSLTSPAAFMGVPEVRGLNPSFNVDPEFSWEVE